jgi:hypothetical protein
MWLINVIYQTRRMVSTNTTCTPLITSGTDHHVQGEPKNQISVLLLEKITDNRVHKPYSLKC